ncbi:MAG: hypothetical protein J5857_08230 [Treponema sp.]|nr:hypothetical protein [Treponema sp.]
MKRTNKICVLAASLILALGLMACSNGTQDSGDSNSSGGGSNSGGGTVTSQYAPFAGTSWTASAGAISLTFNNDGTVTGSGTSTFGVSSYTVSNAGNSYEAIFNVNTAGTEQSKLVIASASATSGRIWVRYITDGTPGEWEGTPTYLYK